jgi:hypothetical protein
MVIVFLRQLPYEKAGILTAEKLIIVGANHIPLRPPFN